MGRYLDLSQPQRSLYTQDLPSGKRGHRPHGQTERHLTEESHTHTLTEIHPHTETQTERHTQTHSEIHRHSATHTDSLLTGIPQ